MAVLGFDEPLWMTVLRERGLDIAMAVSSAVDGIRQLAIEPDLEESRIVATCVTTRPDRYTTAWRLTQALTELWSGFADESVGLRVRVGSLQLDIPATYFAEGNYTRNRWATHARTMLVHGSVHDDAPTGLFDNQGPFRSR